MIDLPTMALDWRYKGLPVAAEGKPPEALGALGIDVLRGECLLPVAVLKESVLVDNSYWMRAFVAAAGVKLCPHGKTTMSPELIAQQLADGAWGITAATASHVRIYRQFGVQRVFLANQLVGHGNVDFVFTELARDPNFDFYALVDSIAGVELLAEAARRFALDRPLNLLVEIGGAGGRTGVRDHAAGIAVAKAVKTAEPLLALRGVEAFEGIYQSGSADAEPVVDMLDRLTELAANCATLGLFGPGTVLLSAGGSAFFDLCADRLTAAGLANAEVILRSGCYIVHDSGLYQDLFAKIRARRPDLRGAGLKPALEIVAVIQSVPESGLAVAAFGKRDAGQDVAMPRPLWWFRAGVHEQPVVLPTDCRVTALYDQHAVLDAPPCLAVGDVIGFGVSHPCTTFDKWRLLLTVDDDYRVTDVVTTWF